MKRFLIAVLLISQVFSSCKKDENSNDLNGNIFGILVNPSGETLPSSLVSIFKNGSVLQQNLTDAFGAFKFLDLPEGAYQLLAYNATYKESGFFDIEVKKNTNHDVTFVFLASLSISGLVMDPFGTVLSGQLVTLIEQNNQKAGYTETTYTNNTGQFYFYGIPDGIYNLTYHTESGREISMLVSLVNDKETKVVLSEGKGGTFIDKRDGHEYKYITLGNQVWMAENLAYLPQIDHRNDGSEDFSYTSGKNYYVYDFYPNSADDESTQVLNAKETDNYKTFGVLYNWHAAMNDESGSSLNPSGIKGACPDGWHLPSVNEWIEMRTWISQNSSFYVSQALKTKGNINDGTGIWYASNYEGKDDYKFAAVPAGYRQYNGGSFTQIFYNSYYWTSQGYNAQNSYYIYLSYNSSTFNYSSTYNSYGWSVRCVKDE